MRAAFAVLTAAAAALSTAGAPPVQRWTCTSRFALDGRTAYMWRDFDSAGAVHAYFIQTGTTEPHATYWTIDPRPAGPPPEEPLGSTTGRSEAAVLRDGPDSVGIDYIWQAPATGPIYAHFWGDGRYAGAQQVYTAAQARRHIGRDEGRLGGLVSGLRQGPVLRALYPAREWTVKAIDQTGKEVFAETFRPPDLARSLAAWRERRAEIERLEAAFRTDYETRTSGPTTCALNDDEGVL